jgi:hypothetical protein
MKLPTRKVFLCLLPCFLAVPLPVDESDPPGRAARLSYARGSVLLQPSGDEQWRQASANYAIITGHRLYTDSDSRAELEAGSSVVRMSPATDLTVVNLSDQILATQPGAGFYPAHGLCRITGQPGGNRHAKWLSQYSEPRLVPGGCGPQCRFDAGACE